MTEAYHEIHTLKEFIRGLEKGEYEGDGRKKEEIKTKVATSLGSYMKESDGSRSDPRSTQRRTSVQEEWPPAGLPHFPDEEAVESRRPVVVHVQDENLILQNESLHGQILTQLHALTPLNYPLDYGPSKPCILQILRCKGYLAQGIAAIDIMGPEKPDMTIVLDATLSNSHPFVTWIVHFVDAFASASSKGLELTLRLSCVYSMFHLLRWMIEHTAENYHRVPEFLKPSVIQLFVPHSPWIDFVIL